MQALTDLGYSARWEALFAAHAGPGRAPARVVRSDRSSALIATANGIVRAKPATRLLKAARAAAELPAVGDWVVVTVPPGLDTALIEAVLERTSAITRGASGAGTELQVLAANIDTVFVVHPMADVPNLRRIERELALAWDSGAIPVVVLTKADLAADADAMQSSVQEVAPGVEVLVTSAAAGRGVDLVRDRISRQRTGVLIGPSGAGKSTLLNALVGEARQTTREVRLNDGRGRHTTVARELIPLAGGGVLIDTPGLRALSLTGSEEGIVAAFPDIETAAGSCRFRDCSHHHEPGCAVQAAVQSGGLPPERLASYHKLRREAHVAAMRTDARLRAEQERKWKIIHKAAREYYKRTGRG